jgi:hypothetical protein
LDFKTYRRKVLTGFIWLRMMGPVVGFYEHGHKLSGFVKCWDCFDYLMALASPQRMLIHGVDFNQ